MKGAIIANCGKMGLNWERMSMSGYFEALAALNGESGGKVTVSDGLKQFMAAHGMSA